MPRRISKRDLRSPRSAYGAGALWMGAPFVAIGTALALLGFGAFRVKPAANAPLWVLGAIGVAFALAGSVLVFNGIRGLRNRSPSGSGPWFRDFPWDPTGIQDQPAGRWLEAVVGFLLLGTFLVPFNWWAFASAEGNLFVQAITGLFDLIALCVLCAAGTRLLQLLKVGRSRLRFEEFPFHPGGSLRVVFEPNRFDRIKFTLRFVEERFERSGTGRNRTVRLVSLEHYSEVLDITTTTLAPEVPVVMRLPKNPEWVTELSGKPARYWELQAEAEAPGVDLDTSFVLPVYSAASPQATVSIPVPAPRRRRSRRARGSRRPARVS